MDKDNDTAAKREDRQKVAEQVTKAVSDTVSGFALDSNAKKYVEEGVQDFADRYADGTAQPEEIESFMNKLKKGDTVEVLRTSHLASILRFQSFRKHIHRSGLNASTKLLGDGILKELTPAVALRRINTEKIHWLESKLPRKGANLEGRKLDEVVREFLSSSLAAVNSIKGLPEGPPGSRERLQFLHSTEALRRR